MPRRRKPLDQGELMAVTLVCLSCREERVIHVPRERDATGGGLLGVLRVPGLRRAFPRMRKKASREGQ